MLSLRSVLAAAALFASAVQADYVIDPNSVPLATRQQWCTSELSTCPLICEQTPPGGYSVNSCDPKQLTYGCVCANGLQPNVSEYSLTLPYFTCQEWGNQCVAGCGEDSSCASDCRQNHPCGASNPTKVNSTTASTMSATGTATSATGSDAIYTGLAGSSQTDSAKSGAARWMVQQDGTIFGVFVIAASVCLGAALL
ncbi:hypothetical protein GGR56DRAFT_649007 [Xylariaceae sp. FL0804]|nr:hypothetical protein GGR56DRAFT_649007 [Xylariaceae sp. FL0804]